MKPVFAVSVVVVLLVGSAVAVGRLSRGDEARLSRIVAAYMDPQTKDKKRQEAEDAFAKFFMREHKRDLTDVKSLTDILCRSSIRPNERPGVRTIKVPGSDVGLPYDVSYTISIPRRYSGTLTSDPWPLIICLPDRGEKPEEYLDTYWASPKIRSNYLIAVLHMDYSSSEVKTTKEVTAKDGTTEMKTVTEKEPFTWMGSRAARQFWKSIYDILMKRFKVDYSRIIVDGAGFGSDGAIRLAAGTTWRFAGIIVRDGTSGSPCVANLSHIPVLWLPAMGKKGGKPGKMEAELKKMLGKSFEEGSADAKWAASGKKGEGAALEAWLDKCVRQRYPLPSKWVAAKPGDRFGYWCFIGQTITDDKPSTVSIRAAGKHKIEVDTTNVANVRIFLNDLLVDMGSKFELDVNGKKIGEFTRERSAEQVLAHANDRPPRDPGVVFTNELSSIDIPVPQTGSNSAKAGKNGGK